MNNPTEVTVTFKLKVGDEPEDEFAVVIQSTGDKLVNLHKEWQGLKTDMPAILKEYELSGEIKQ